MATSKYDIPVFDRASSLVTEEQAQLLSQINQSTANVPAPVMVEATKKNINLDFLDPFTDFFSKAVGAPYKRLKESLIYNPLNINPDTASLPELAVKGAFFGVMELWEKWLPRIGRSTTLKRQGVEDAWDKANVSPYQLWKDAKERGEVIDLGSALFGDTNPEKTEKYKELIDKGVDPLKARDIVLAEMGVNIWSALEEEQRKVRLPEETAKELEARGESGHSTFGRAMWQPFHFIAGPEDKAYDYYTGTIDLIANLFDPTFLLGKGVKSVKAARGMLALSPEAANSLGLSEGIVRKVFSTKTADQVIKSKMGDKVADFLYTNRNNPADILKYSNFKFVNKYKIADEQLADDFAQFTTRLSDLGEMDIKAGRQAVKDLLLENIDYKNVTRQPNLRVLAAATEGLVPKIQKNNSWRNNLRKYFGAQYKTNVTGRNPDALMVHYTKFLQTLDPQEKLIDHNKRLRTMMKNLDELQTKDPLTRSAIIVNSIVEDMNDYKEIYTGALKNVGKDTAIINDLFNVLGKYQKEVIEEVAKNKTIYNNLGKNIDEPQILKLADELGEDADELTKLAANEQLNLQPILETTLTQEAILPDVSQVIKLANKLDRGMKGQYKNLVDIVGKGGSKLGLDFYMGTIFKPLVLLRPAWTLRVVGEEQLRILADGVIGVTERPMQLISRIIGSPSKRAYKTERGWGGGMTFEKGIGESESVAFGAVSGFDSTVKWDNVNKIEDLTKWGEGQVNVITKLMQSKIAKRIAEIRLLDPADQAKAYNQLVTDLLTRGTPEFEALQAVAVKGNNLFAKYFEVAKKGNNRDVMGEFIDMLEQHIKNSVTKTGQEDVANGIWELIATGKFTNVVDDIKKIGSLNYKGRWHNTPTVHLIKTIEENNLEIYVKNRKGNLVRLGLDKTAQIGENAIQGSPMFDDGKIAIVSVVKKVKDGYALDLYGKNPDDLAKLEKALPLSLDPIQKPKGTPYELIPEDVADNTVLDLNKLVDEIIDPKSGEKLSKKKMQELEEAWNTDLQVGIKEYVDEFGDLLPDIVKWKSQPIPAKQSTWDKWVQWGMEILMTNRTNNLSRIPVFKAQYWKKSRELIAISTEEVKQKIIAGARKANLAESEIKKMEKVSSVADGINDANLIELFAKGSGVDKVKGLLYDITEKRRFWEATRWIFPFGNAYQEVITTWVGLMRANPSIVPRTQTIWAGSTQPTDTFEDTGSGFFFENPTNGQAVFNYPGTGLVQNYMFGDDDTTKINMPVYASSINIAASIMPGFGPVISIPAAFVLKNQPGESWWNNLIFGNFPAPDVTDPKSIAKSIGMPSWLDKVATLIWNKEENTTGIYGNTVMDTYKALLYSGQINDSTEEGMKAGMELALDKSKTLYALRIASQFIGPSGVASPIYELKPENMDYFMFETLADEYRTIKESVNYDDAVATAKFIEKYGLNPLPLTVSKSISIEKSPVTVEGFDWYKENQDLYELYPLVAWYLEPPPVYAEFSFPAYRAGLQSNARVYRTPEQWAIAKNKLLGAIALRQYEQTIGITGNNTDAARALRNAKKKELEQTYWGYGQPSIVGQPAKPSIEMQVNQLIKMAQDPNLQDNEVMIATNKYLAKRQLIIDEFVAAGMSETIWKSSSKYIGVRNMLRAYANQLIQETGNFGPLFDQLLSKELEPEYEDNLLLELKGDSK